MALIVAAAGEWAAGDVTGRRASVGRESRNQYHLRGTRWLIAP